MALAEVQPRMTPYHETLNALDGAHALAARVLEVVDLLVGFPQGDGDSGGNPMAEPPGKLPYMQRQAEQAMSDIQVAHQALSRLLSEFGESSVAAREYVDCADSTVAPSGRVPGQRIG